SSIFNRFIAMFRSSKASSNTPDVRSSHVWRLPADVRHCFWGRILLLVWQWAKTPQRLHLFDARYGELHRVHIHVSITAFGLQTANEHNIDTCSTLMLIEPLHRATIVATSHSRVKFHPNEPRRIAIRAV